MWYANTEQPDDPTWTTGPVDEPTALMSRATRRLAEPPAAARTTRLAWVLILIGTLLLGHPLSTWAVGLRVVTSGVYTITPRDVRATNLLITSGRVTVADDARIAGAVVMTSGVLCVEGAIAGNVYLTSGTIRLGPRGVLHGQVYATSGRVERAQQTCAER